MATTTIYRELAEATRLEILRDACVCGEDYSLDSARVFRAEDSTLWVGRDSTPCECCGTPFDDFSEAVLTQAPDEAAAEALFQEHAAALRA